MTGQPTIRAPRYWLWMQAVLDRPLWRALDVLFTGIVIGLIVSALVFLTYVLIAVAFDITRESLRQYRFVLLGVLGVAAALAAGLSFRMRLRGASVILDIAMFVGDLFL